MTFIQTTWNLPHGIFLPVIALKIEPLNISWVLYDKIIQKLLGLQLSLKISYSGTFWQQTFCKLPLVSICYSFRDMANFWYADKFEN